MDNNAQHTVSSTVSLGISSTLFRIHSEHICNTVKCHDIAYNAIGTVTVMMEMIRENVIKSQYYEQNSRISI